MDESVPTGAWEAAAWLAERHPVVQSLVARIVVGGTAREDWIDGLTAAVVENATYERDWVRYEATHPEPRDAAAIDSWEAAGPQASDTVHAFRVMSSGEQRLVRLLATLGGRVPWSVSDVSFDQRGAAVLHDWLRVVRAQLPDSFYGELSSSAKDRGGPAPALLQTIECV